MHAMPGWLLPLFTLLFAAHLAAFLRLAFARGGAYYWLVTALFLALTGAFGVRWLAPGADLAGQPIHVLLRYAAWALAAVTLPMLGIRLARRRRARSG